MKTVYMEDSEESTRVERVNPLQNLFTESVLVVVVVYVLVRRRCVAVMGSVLEVA